MRRAWLMAAMLLGGCFRPAPCTQDSECGGAGGKCDVARAFCVTISEVADGGEDAGPADAGGVDAGSTDAGSTDAGSTDGGGDGGVVDAGAPPTVSATTPLPPATNVPIDQRLTATFTEPMDSTTITPLSFTLVQGTTNIDGGVMFDGGSNTATFVPATSLATNRVYVATLTTGARSAGGLPLAASHTWSFTTALIALRSAQTYSVLGASITNTGATTLSGDLGVSTAAPIMGGATIVVGGTTRAGTAPAIQARSDLQQAYSSVAGLQSTGTLTTLDGLTLTPGVYSASAALTLSTNVTLDGESDPNAVFIFKIDAALDTAATTSTITLMRGARAENVFWRVSGAVTLGATSSFKGTIIGLTAITVGAGTAVDGRALTIDGLVTLSSNTIGN